MALERTFSIVKPDGVARNLIGEVYRRFEQAGLRVVAARMVRLSQAEAEGFYAVHRERPFFKDLVKYMTSGPVMLQVLEMHRVEALSLALREVGHAGGNDTQPRLLETTVDLTDEVTGHAIGFDDRKSALQRHGTVPSVCVKGKRANA